MTARDELAEDERVKELMNRVRCWGGGSGALFLDSRDVQSVMAALVAEVRELRRTAYVLAMAILQSDIYREADDELRNAVSLAVTRHEEGA